MRKILIQPLVINCLLLTTGLVQAANSELHFMNNQNIADLSQIKDSYQPGQNKPVFDSNHTLPNEVLASSSDYASITGQYESPQFLFSVDYSLIDGTTNPVTEGKISLEVTNSYCKINGTSGRPEADQSSKLPIKVMETPNNVYWADLTDDPHPSDREASICKLIITAKENASKQCDQYPNQDECIEACKESNGAEAWCSALCEDGDYEWCGSSPTPITNAVVNIKNQIQ